MRANLFYTNPRLTALALLFICVMGSMAYLTLARQEDPTMTERWAGVNTFMPGATAERIESLVSEPIETALREIPEISRLESTSKAGFSVVGIELYDSTSADQVDAIWSEVRDKLGDVAPALPEGASEPELVQRKPLASTMILSLEWVDQSPMQIGIMSRLAESLRIQLANTSGTEKAETWGEAEEEILVSLDPYRLAESGLTARQVAQRIRAADTKIASGRLLSRSANLLVEVDAELDSPERIARIPLAMSPGGTVLRVSDIAEVKKHWVDPPISKALHSTEPVILINAKMQPNQRIGEWTERTRAIVDAFRADLPPQIRLKEVYGQIEYTSERMNSLATNLVFAFLIVVLVLIWFMGARSALTVGIALPLSGAMVLSGMQFLDIPLHQMSVTGLIISLGLLIDNAIVVVEEFKLRRRRGDSIAAAIDHAVRHLVVPLAASTATTVFAFMPIALAPGGVGDFTGTIGVTVALAVASSFLLAMTVVPAVAGFIEDRWPTGDGQRWWQTGFRHAGMARRYREIVLFTLKQPAAGIALGCLLPLIGFGLAHTLTNQFFPPVDRNQFQVQLELPSHASINETEAAIQTADAILRANPGVVDTFWSIGKSTPRVFYNVISLNERVTSFAGAWVNTTSAETTQRILPELQAQLAEALPHAQVLAIPFEQGPPTAAPIEIRVLGSDLAVLRERGEELRRILSRVPDVTYTRATLSRTEPKLAFTPNENAAAIVGLTTGELARHLNASLSGEMAGTVQEANAEIGVRVRLGDEYRNNVAALTTLPMVTLAGRSVPLDQLGSWQMVPTAASIERFQGQRVNTVHGFITPFTLPSGVLKEFNRRLEQEGFALPAGYALQIGGEAEESGQAMGKILSIFAFFALAMIIVVILSLNSFSQALLIGFVALLSFGLALFGVRLFGYPFGYMALIGSLGMMGLAINGAIIVLSALKASTEALDGDLEETADVVVDATRHIVSTTATTIGGFVPLIVAGGTFWPPLATAIAGGVAGSAIIALFTVPAVFAWLHRARPGEAVSAPAGAVAELRSELPTLAAAAS